MTFLMLNDSMTQKNMIFKFQHIKLFFYKKQFINVEMFAQIEIQRKTLPKTSQLFHRIRSHHAENYFLGK